MNISMPLNKLTVAKMRELKRLDHELQYVRGQIDGIKAVLDMAESIFPEDEPQELLKQCEDDYAEKTKEFSKIRRELEPSDEWGDVL